MAPVLVHSALGPALKYFSTKYLMTGVTWLASLVFVSILKKLCKETPGSITAAAALSFILL